MFSNTSYSGATVDISIGPDLPTRFPDFLLGPGQLSPLAAATHHSWDSGAARFSITRLPVSPTDQNHTAGVL